jgi:hypothetical protein
VRWPRAAEAIVVRKDDGKEKMKEDQELHGSAKALYELNRHSGRYLKGEVNFKGYRSRVIRVPVAKQGKVRQSISSLA